MKAEAVLLNAQWAAQVLAAKGIVDPSGLLRGIVEVVSVNDALAINASKVLTDIVSSADSLTLALTKAFQDTTTASDLITLVNAFQRQFADTVTNTDSAKLLNQNYADSSTYFADDYVGTGITF